MSSKAATLTQWIHDAQAGDSKASEKVLNAVYAELKRIAAKRLAGRRGGNSLSPTALVHEAFLKLNANDELEIRDRRHYLALVCQCMRWVLVDHVREKHSKKRGGVLIRVNFDENLATTGESDVDLHELNQALEKLSERDERLGKVVELRFLVGLSVEETASLLETSTGTIKRDWSVARAWLLRELKKA